MEPPDVLGMAQDPGPAPKLPDRKKSKLLLLFVTVWVYRIVPIDLFPALVVATSLCNLAILTPLTSALKVRAVCFLQDVAFCLQHYRV